MTIDQILTAEEGQTFDRKSLKIAPKDLANTIVAFANSDGGVIAIGVSDATKRIEGIDHDYDKTKLNEILRVPLDFCIPSVAVKTEMVDCIDYKGRPNRVLVFHIEPSNKLHTNQADEAYVRVGDKSRKLSFDDRLQLMYDKGLMLFEETAVDHATLDDIDMDAVADYCNTIGYGKSVREFLMESRGYVVEKKGVPTPTVAAILLFGKQPQQFFPYAKIRFIRYSGTEEKTGAEMNVIKDVEFTGTIKQQIDKAVEYLGTQISEHTYLGSKGLFVTDDEYPAFVRQEIIVNAACHRDYGIHGTDTQVKMFTNRLVVESPGTLPGRVRPDNIRHTHFSRNPRIAQFLKAYNYVKEFGEGVDRMCRELEAADCGDVIFFPYAFMLRATAMNRIGHAQSDNERLNLSIMNDSPEDERLAPPKVTLSPKSGPLRGPKVILSPQSDTFDGSKVIHSPKSDPLETPIMKDFPDNERLNLSIMNDSPNNERLEAPIMKDSPDNERLENSIMKDSPRSPYAIFQHQRQRIEALREKISRGNLRKPTINALEKIVLSFADNEVFGTKEICALISCSGPNAWRLILKLLEFDLVHPIRAMAKVAICSKIYRNR